MFARLDFPQFLVCCSGDLSANESEEKPSVAICGGSICILTGLGGPNKLQVESSVPRGVCSCQVQKNYYNYTR